MKIIAKIIGSFAGVSFCIATVYFLNWLEISPTFPAYGGESDFNFRFSWFLLMLLPGFLLLGAWIANLFASTAKKGLYATVGAVTGTSIYIAVLITLKSRIENITDESTANSSFLLLLVTWLTLTTLGIYFGSTIARRSQDAG